jgi:hypothetical protein
MEKPHGGIGVKLIFEAKYSHNWTKACNPCKNLKTKSTQNYYWVKT